MSFFSKKIYLFFLLFFIMPFILPKTSRIKSIGDVKKVIQLQNDFEYVKKDALIKSDKDYKYVVFDISNCFWKPSLYDLLMSLKKSVKISFSGYLDLLQCGVSYALGTLDAKKGYETFFKYLNKMTKTEVESKCKTVWNNDCKNFIYKEAFERLERHKKDGLITIAVDAGISQLYGELVDIYKFDYIFTSKLEFKDGLATGKLDGDPCSNQHKYVTIKKLIEQDLKGSLDDVIFYANSHNDIPLLEHVGKPIAVNPNKKLLRKANKSNWEILNFFEIG